MEQAFIAVLPFSFLLHTVFADFMALLTNFVVVVSWEDYFAFGLAALFFGMWSCTFTGTGQHSKERYEPTHTVISTLLSAHDIMCPYLLCDI